MIDTMVRLWSALYIRLRSYRVVYQPTTDLRDFEVPDTHYPFF